MKKILSIIIILTVLGIASCKKSSSDIIAPTTTQDIKVPTGFNWQNSRTINFTVVVTDQSFKTMPYSIAIYDGNPYSGGILLARGAATTALAFKSKTLISNQVSQVYVVKTSPDNYTVVQIINVGTSDVTISIGQ